MLTALLAVTVALATPQSPTVTQAQYNDFKRCHGEIFGHYRAGVIVFAGDDPGVANVEAASKPMDDALIMMDREFARSGLGLDLQAGYAAYQSGVQRWDSFPNRSNARQQWVAGDPMSPHCRQAIGQIAAFLDAR